MLACFKQSTPGMHQLRETINAGVPEVLQLTHVSEAAAVTHLSTQIGCCSSLLWEKELHTKGLPQSAAVPLSDCFWLQQCGGARGHGRCAGCSGSWWRSIGVAPLLNCVAKAAPRPTAHAQESHLCGG